MESLMNAIRTYFDTRNQCWITGDPDPLHVLTAGGRRALGRDVGFALGLKRRAVEQRRTKLVRSHTRLQVRRIQEREDGRAAEVVADEHVTWVYRDGADYNVEARVIRHWQIWQRSARQWRLQQDIESDERTPNPVPTDERTAADNGQAELDTLWMELRENCTRYDRVRALRYAELWWDSFNPTFFRFPDDDCTNFISQCLYAGHMRMTGGQDRSSGWWYRFATKSRPAAWSYSWAVSHLLYLHLVQRVGARTTQNARDLRIGDLIFYDWDGNGRYSHSTIVTDFDGRGDPLVNAHTDPSYHRHYRYLDSRAWTPRTRYAFVRMPDEFC